MTTVQTIDNYSEAAWDNLRAICERVNLGRVQHVIHLEDTTPNTHLLKIYECAYGIRCRVTPLYHGVYVLDFIDSSDNRLSFDVVSQISVWDITERDEHVRLRTKQQRTSDIYLLQPMGHFKVCRGEEVLVKIHFPPTIEFYNDAPDLSHSFSSKCAL
ncbi:hypothetical protein BJ138DRAFT_1160675 [Hygrophoropsis aurantiaca]|uniref:Uncharacterized protein n=1 Tax=Hygrophoropsis aurantiaca TaxID=72124 RepID=A0ACB8A1E5_9AGAM|nr:hypothetical protein BJ138DRAFT_1160675 [Hygrophoropsis aurantiaca]